MLAKLAERNPALALTVRATAEAFGLDPDLFAAYNLGMLDANDASLSMIAKADVERAIAAAEVEATMSEEPTENDTQGD